MSRAFRVRAGRAVKHYGGREDSSGEVSGFRAAQLREQFVAFVNTRDVAMLVASVDGCRWIAAGAWRVCCRACC